MPEDKTTEAPNVQVRDLRDLLRNQREMEARLHAQMEGLRDVLYAAIFIFFLFYVLRGRK